MGRALDGFLIDVHRRPNHLRGIAATLLVLTLPGSAEAQPAPDPPPLKITTVDPATQRLETPPTEEQRKGQLQRLSNAQKALATLPSAAPITRTSLTAEVQRLQQLLAHAPRCNPAAEVRRLERDLALAAAGQPPHATGGVHRLAYRSPLDRNLHPFVAYVPQSYTTSGDRRYPLVVMLHGMRSTAMRAMGRVFGVADGAMKDAAVTCDRPRLPQQQTLVVAPEAFGDTFYRLAGERDVTAVVRMMIRLYRVDRRRITITGLSMGGTGAVELALQQPHLYAGVVALCGYYDRRLDSRFRGQTLQPWERFMMTVYSPVDWAENGRGIPLRLIHGKWDGPQRAEALQRRYQHLGYAVKLETYDKGHEVWEPGYAGGRIFPVLAQMRQGAPPKRVTFVSGRSRVRKSYWVVIEGWTDYSRWARVDAQIKSSTEVQVSTQNVVSLRLDLPASYVKPPARLVVDGTALEIAGKRNRWVQRVRLTRARSGEASPECGAERAKCDRAGKSWQLADAPASRPSGLVKRPGLAGPLEDIYFDPILVVYGTGGGEEQRLHKLAKTLAGYSRHARLSYPMIPDWRFSPALVRHRSVILVGNEQTNSVLARIGPRLPIRVLAQEVRFGGRTIQRPNIGATFVYPNPDSPNWYVVVVGGTSEESYKLWRQLPELLPDYVVFDNQMAASRWRMVLGSGRSAVEAGYFDGAWGLPAAR